MEVAKLPANFFLASGSAETLHRAVFHYLVAKYNTGDIGDFVHLAAGIGMQLPPGRLECQNEYCKADLAILRADSEELVAIIEFKVDSCEGWSQEGYQTAVYRRRVLAIHPGFDQFYYITLGLSEYEGEPADDAWKMLTLGKLVSVAEGLSEDPIVRQWAEALRFEFRGRSEFASARSTSDYIFSREKWNIYTLHEIAEAAKSRSELSQVIAPSVFLHGSSPDTILHFGDNETVYAEINQNGRLNVKIDLSKVPTAERSAHVREFARVALEKFSHLGPRARRRRQAEGDSATLVSFEVGLFEEDRFLDYRSSLADTLTSLSPILQEVYSAPWR